VVVGFAGGSQIHFDGRLCGESGSSKEELDPENRVMRLGSIIQMRRSGRGDYGAAEAVGFTTVGGGVDLSGIAVGEGQEERGAVDHAGFA